MNRDCRIAETYLLRIKTLIIFRMLSSLNETVLVRDYSGEMGKGWDWRRGARRERNLATVFQLSMLTLLIYNCIWTIRCWYIFIYVLHYLIESSLKLIFIDLYN